MTQEKKPRAHAELIKAWADGAGIEFWNGGVWRDCPRPLWYSDYKYRIKPEPIKTERYRRWISKIDCFGEFRYQIHTASERQNVGIVEGHCVFHRWVDKDWQEGVVVDA